MDKTDKTEERSLESEGSPSPTSLQVGATGRVIRPGDESDANTGSYGSSAENVATSTTSKAKLALSSKSLDIEMGLQEMGLKKIRTKEVKMKKPGPHFRKMPEKCKYNGSPKEDGT